MGGSYFGRLGLAAAAIAAAAILQIPEAKAITYGEPDCEDIATNFKCEHPNTVSLSGFREPTPAEEELVEAGTLISFVRCSGSLLAEDDNRFVILTAGHCASAYLAGLQDGSIKEVGVSFDAKIVKDLTAISETVWSQAQYILGGQPVLPVEYGPQGANASIIQFDYAVIVFELAENERETEGGELVDLSEIDPVLLPEQDYLLEQVEVSATDPLQLTAVGYGTGEAHNKPGDGGNAGGAVNSTEEFGERWMTTLTSVFSFMGPEKNLLFGSQNPARGNEGTCGGDSGGPMFHAIDEDTEIQVGITSSGDAICRATSIIARTDGARAVEFLSCARTSGPDIAECGCIEVNSQGECPQD
jgi:Trypsin